MSDPQTIVADIRRDGFSHLGGGALARLLGPEAMAAWPAFAATWNDLGPDLYMADGGRYRRRRHAAFEMAGGEARRKPHQPHYQSRDYNPLNGGVQRWFEPVSAAAQANPVTQGLLRFSAEVFGALAGRPARPWHVELHQFRVEARAGAEGRPTPEGLHRDGVDFVLVMLVARENVAEGVTEIGDAAGAPLGRFVLAAPGDAVVLDDQRILHGVTPIRARTLLGRPFGTPWWPRSLRRDRRMASLCAFGAHLALKPGEGTGMFAPWPNARPCSSSMTTKTCAARSPNSSRKRASLRSRPPPEAPE